jgi:hypothetical protein
MTWHQVKNWSLFVFLLLSVGGGLLFTAAMSQTLYKQTHDISYAWTELFFICGVITLIVMMKEVE